jgi:peptidoglycan/LPS O-acetylase OafA/YrhL
MKKENFAGIDVLRFLAATFVGLFHIAFMNTRSPGSSAFLISGGTFDYAAIHPLTSIGWVGVQVFFVISGFVIFGFAKGTASAFARSRALRLFPAVWICAPISLLICLAFAAYPSSEALTRIVRSLLLWPKGNWVDGVYWTLGIEICFYLVVFVHLACNARRAIFWFCLMIGTMSASYWLAHWGMQGQFDFPLVQRLTQIDSFERYFELSLIPHGCYFAIGAVLYALLCEGKSRFLWVAVGYFSLGACFEIRTTALTQGTATHFEMNYLLAQGLWLLSVVALILSVKLGDRISKTLSKLHSRDLGSMTYPFYLLHTTVGAALLSVSSMLGLNLWFALLLVLLCVALLSYLVHKYGEVPLKNAMTIQPDVTMGRFWAKRAQAGFVQPSQIQAKS